MIGRQSPIEREMATVATVAPETQAALAPPGGTAGARLRMAAVAALVVFAAGFVVVGHHRLTMPFGDSHDGRNGAQWGLGSRDLRDRGIVTSHLGADLVAGTVRFTYTDHPPLIFSETAVAELVGGEHPWATRLPAWLGSLAAIALCYCLLRRCGITPSAAAVGVTLGLGCPMFGAYGMMNDPWILGLPWGVAILLLWQERRSGIQRPAWLLGAVALAGALTSWVNVIELGLLAIAELVVRARRRRPDAFVPVAAGAAIGVVLTVAWVAWAHGGSVRSLIDQAGNRTSAGSDHVTVSVLVSYLKSYWADTFTPWQIVLAIPVLVVGWLEPRVRPVIAVSLATAAIWIVVFSDGAAHHDYWGYWLVLPLVLGFAVAAELAVRGRSKPVAISLVVASVAVGVLGFEMPKTIPDTLTHGAGAGAALLAARSSLPPDQPYIWYLGDVVQTPYWIAYPFHRPAARLVNLHAVDALASVRPRDLVLVASDRLTSDLKPGPGSACRAGVPARLDYGVVTALELDRALRSGRCPAVAAATTPVPGTSPSLPTPVGVAP